MTAEWKYKTAYNTLKLRGDTYRLRSLENLWNMYLEFKKGQSDDKLEQLEDRVSSQIDGLMGYKGW